MNSSQFSQALDSFGDSPIDIIPFICKSCNVPFDIANMLYTNNKSKLDRNTRIYKSLPILARNNLKKFDDFTLTVKIEFNYGT